MDQCWRGYHHIKRALLSDRSNHRANGEGIKGHRWVVVMARAWQCCFGGRIEAESVEWRAMDENCGVAKHAIENNEVSQSGNSVMMM